MKVHVLVEQIMVKDAFHILMERFEVTRIGDHSIKIDTVCGDLDSHNIVVAVVPPTFMTVGHETQFVADTRRAPYDVSVAQPDAGLTPNTVLVELREKAGLSQQGMATDLNRFSMEKHNKHAKLTAKSVWRWETGRTIHPRRFYLQLLSDYFEVEIAQLGLPRRHRLHPRPACQTDHSRGVTEGLVADAPEIIAEQDHWRETRKALGMTRRLLAVLAEQLYPEHRLPGLKHTGVITHPAWIPGTPIPLHTVQLTLDLDAPEPLVTGAEQESSTVRPRLSPEQRYRCYHYAIRDLSAPTLFENRLCFRLTGLDWTLPTIFMRFGHMGFFDSMDTNEVLAHETALHHLARNHAGELITTKPSWRGLTFRKLIGDPFDLSRRPLMGAIGTLTIRGGESPSVVLHHRDDNKVAGGGGMAHLLPAGVFQPSSVLPTAVAEDFSIWRNIQREYAEELLGRDEYDGSGRPIAYDQLEPFVSMDHALQTGGIQVWCLGIILDALAQYPPGCSPSSPTPSTTCVRRDSYPQVLRQHYIWHGNTGRKS